MIPHPIIAAVCDVRASLKAVAGASPTFMSTLEKAAALRELAAAEGLETRRSDVRRQLVQLDHPDLALEDVRHPRSWVGLEAHHGVLPGREPVVDRHPPSR